MSFTEMFEKQRAFMLHASTCTSQYDEPHRRLYGEILGLLDEAKQAERERASLQNVVDYITMRFYQIFGRPAGEAPEMMDSVQALQADLDAALVLCVASDWDVEVLGAGYEPEVYKAHAHVLPLLEKRRENRGTGAATTSKPYSTLPSIASVKRARRPAVADTPDVLKRLEERKPVPADLRTKLKALVDEWRREAGYENVDRAEAAVFKSCARELAALLEESEPVKCRHGKDCVECEQEREPAQDEHIHTAGWGGEPCVICGEPVGGPDCEAKAKLPLGHEFVAAVDSLGRASKSSADFCGECGQPREAH